MSARSLNKVILIGNLTRDPELRYTPAGTAVCTFGLATNRSWTTQAGEEKEDTEFHRIVAWNKLAELCAQLLAKGRKVYVEGRLSTHTWSSQDGVQHTTTEIVIEDMIILDSKRVVKEGVAPEFEKTTPAETPEEPKTQAPPVADTMNVSQATGTVVASQASSKKKGGKKEEKGTESKEKPEEKTVNVSENITPEDIPF
jgi:single-strand DNA-binding protein